MTEILTLPVEPKSVVWNPSPEQLRRFTEEMANCRKTEFDNVNVATRVVSRSKGSTYVATDTPENHSDQTISRAEFDRMARLQNDYIRTRDMLVVDGFIGNDPKFRVAARLRHQRRALKIDFGCAASVAVVDRFHRARDNTYPVDRHWCLICRSLCDGGDDPTQRSDCARKTFCQ